MTRKLRPRCSSRLAKKLREGKGLVRTSETRVSGDLFLKHVPATPTSDRVEIFKPKYEIRAYGLQFAAESSGQASPVRACQSVPSCGAEQRLCGVINQDGKVRLACQPVKYRPVFCMTWEKELRCAFSAEREGSDRCLLNWTP